MTSENFTTTVLTAEEGKYLTQSGEVEITERVVATKVALGRGSSADDWCEISSAEAAEITAAKQAAREKEQSAREERRADAWD